MGSKVVVTYKRKRLFSRSDHSHINLHSNTPLEISKPKTSADFNKHERQVEKYTLQNKDSELGICQYSKDKADEIVLQCGNRESDYCDQCSKMLCSACTEQQHTSVSNGIQKFTPEKMRQSPESLQKKSSFHPDILLEESSEERCQVDSAGQSDGEEKCDGTQSKLLSMKSGSGCEKKCKETLSISPPPDTCSGKEPDLMSLKTSDGRSCSLQVKGASILGTFTLEGAEKLTKDQYTGLSNDLGTKRKPTPTLITFSRRSKRNGNTAAAVPNIASESATPPPASYPTDLKNEDVKLMDCNKEKKPPEDYDKSRSFSAPAPATVMVVHTDNPLQEKVCIDIQGSDVENQRVPNATPAVIVDSISSNNIVRCARLPVHGLSRLKLGSYSSAHRITLVPSDEIQEKSHKKIQICIHSNSSLGLCQCENGDWENIQSGIWSSIIGPYADRYIDVKFVENLSGSVTVSVELEFHRWRLICLDVGFVLLLLAPIVSSWVPFYYSSSMTIGVCLLVIIVLFQGMKLLPTGRKNAIYSTICGLALGAGTFLLNRLTTLVNSVLLNFGISEELHNRVLVFLLVGVVLAGAAFGYSLVLKFVVVEDGSVDVGVAQIVKWALRIVAVTIIFQSTLDTPLALGMLVSLLGFSCSLPLFKSHGFRAARFLSFKLHSEIYTKGNATALWLKRKSNLISITFRRRSKRNGNTASAAPNVASESEEPPPASCPTDMNNEAVKLMDCNNEKKRPKDCDTACSFSAPAPANAMVVHTDNPLHGEAKNTPTAATQLFQNSCVEMPLLQEKVVRPQNLSDEDVNSRGTPNDVQGKRDRQLLLDLSISPQASCDVDCNRPLDGGSDDYHPCEPSEVHVSLGSTSKLKEKISSLQVHDFMERSVRDKGKFIVNSQPVVTGTSSESNGIQLFPENKSVNSSTQHTEQMVDGHAFFSSSYQWPNIQEQPREPFHNFFQPTPDRAQSFSRQEMMLDNRNRSSFLDKFDLPTTWSDEELDSLWIGVRRHGPGNWDAILRDWKLNFSPCKTSGDLAKKWMDEQPQLFCNGSVSQPKYSTPLDEDQVQLSLGAVQKQPSLHFMNEMQLQRPGNVSSSSCLSNGYWGLFNPSNESPSNAHPMKESLPHWLKAAVEVPPKQSALDQPGVNCSGNTQQQPWLNNRYISVL